MAHDVFVSYSSKDKPVADATCATLEAHGIRCWIAPRDIIPGTEWGKAIVDGISGSRIMVLIFSSNADQSRQVMREAERAVHKGLSLLPLRIEEVIPTGAMEYYLSTPHWLDALIPPLEQHLANLTRTVQTLLSLQNEHEATAAGLQASLQGTPLPGVVTAESPTPAPTPTPKLAVPGIPESNLPQPFTRFFGREEDLDQLEALLRDERTRLITLTGSAGTGKTRLAIEAAGRMCEDFGDAVWFADLAEKTEPRQIADTVLESLQLPRSPGVEPMDQIVEVLGRQPSLLVLDNFDQLAEQGSAVLRTLLKKAGDLKCLVTSRQVLYLDAEREFAVTPLPTPSPTLRSAEALRQFGSVQLFVDRVQAVRRDFQLTDANAAAVAELCDRLEGIPLAIELAAARAQVLTPAQMLAQLTRRFDFLASRKRDGDSRHRTLRAAIDWSYELLSPDLQQFWTRLSVFRRGWTLPAAEEVSKDPLSLDNLEQLRDSSLVLTEEVMVGDEPEMRFRMLESLREYAQDRLAESGEAEERKGRHADWYVALAEQAEPEFTGAEQSVWLQRLAAEQDNFRAALSYCETAESGGELGLRIAGALWQFWYVQGYISEGRTWLEAVLLRAPDGPAELRAKVLAGAGGLALFQGDFTQAQAHYEACLALRRELGDKKGAANILTGLATVALLRGDLEAARTQYTESLAAQRELGNASGIADALLDLGTVTRELGDVTAARTLYQESLALRRKSGDKRGAAGALINLGIASHGLGDTAAARTFYDEALVIERELKDKPGIADALHNLALVAGETADFAQAHSLYAESLALKQEIGDRRGMVDSLEGIAALAGAEGSPKQAARLWGAASALREALEAPLPPAEQEIVARDQAAARAALGEEVFAAAWETGRAMTLEDAAAQALRGPDD